MGYTHIQRGDPEAAIAVLQRILDPSASEGVPPQLLADTRFVLARALWDRPSSSERDRARARALAEDAQRQFRGVRPRTDIDQWLEAHPR